MDNNLGQVVLVKDINPGVSEGYNGSSFANSSSPQDLIEFNDKLYFTADDGENGTELFVSDGTTEGTQLIANVNPGSGYDYNDISMISELTEFSDRLYFSANDGQSGNELFVSDGTAEGTQLLVDFAPDSSSVNDNSFPKYFVEFNDKLYFTVEGNELFATDGTAEGTQLVADIRPGNDDFRYPVVNYIDSLTVFNDKLYFSADDGINGRELWVSDGTTEGTQLFVDLTPGFITSDNRLNGLPYSTSPDDLFEFNDKLYFSASGDERGRELFVSDGTAEGTELLVDLNSNPSEFGFNGSDPGGFVEFNDKLYFTAIAPEQGREIYVSDGTAGGTELLVDLNPGANSSYVSSFVEFDGKLYFTANDGENGTEIFTTDGTAEGIQLITDLNPDTGDYSYNYNISELTVVGDELFFAADDGETGRELYKLIVDDAIAEPVEINGGEGADSLVGLEANEVISGFGGDDTIDGGGGNDTVDGGDGSDRLTSLAGNDSLFGGNGNDTIHSGAGDDTLNGGSGSDRLTSSAGNDSLFGANGNDVLNSGIGADTLNGGGGSDTVSGNSGNDVLSGAGGNDTLNGGSGRDTLSGDSGDDRLLGGGGDDSLIGGNNNDYLDGGGGNDILNGSSGHDVFVLRSDAGTDTIVDFTLGSDRLGLAGGLEFDDLSFSGHDILSAGEVLVSLNGVNVEHLTSSDFELV